MHRALRPAIACGALPLSVVAIVSVASLVPACRGDGPGDGGAAPAAPLTRAQRNDPRACAPCHAAEVREWEGSAHASAADDPLFRAMNRRGQRETSGALGAFCVGCHAPVAVAAGATSDGQNLDDVPAAMKGVTCQVCHAAADLDGAHDPALPFALSDDGVMRGARAGVDAKGLPRTTAHRSAYAPHLDRDDLASSAMCGRCHDVTGPAGAHAGRTFTEWRSSVFADARLGTTCGQCHMPARPADAAVGAVGEVGAMARRDHGFAGARQGAASGLDTVIQSALCVREIGDVHAVQVILENVGAGHSFPAGALPDRRLWVELRAYAGGELLLESGAPAAGADVTSLVDPNLWLSRDCMLDGNGQPTRFVWGATEARTSLLPALSTFDRTDPRYYQTHQVATYPRGSGATLPRAPDRVTMGIRFAPVGLDVADDLIATGDLDPAARAQLTVSTLGKDVEWTPSTATETFRDDGVPTSCVSTTGLVAAADKVPATTGCTGAIPAPPAGPSPTGRVTCTDDAKLDAVAPGLTRAGTLGLFRVSLLAASASRAGDPWRLLVQTAAGEPVSGADVRVQARMRDHGHAPPDVPLARAGDASGAYVVEPLRFFLPGVWRTSFTIDAGGKKDVVTFDFCVEG